MLRVFFVALGLVILDQWSKITVIKKMSLGESIPLIDGIFHLTYVRNPGAAFSMLPYKTTFFITVTSIVITGILIYAWRTPKEKVLFRTALSLMLGGAVGNLIDRIRYASVIDYFDFRVFPVFNVADIGICVGVALLFIDIIREERDNRMANDQDKIID